MLGYKMSHQVSSLTNPVQTRRVTDADASRELEKTIEILEAQVERLGLELCYKKHELEEMPQELRSINQELCTVTNSEQLTLEAEELARKFLASEKPLKDALVELLIAVYNVPVNLEELVAYAD